MDHPLVTWINLYGGHHRAVRWLLDGVTVEYRQRKRLRVVLGNIHDSVAVEQAIEGHNIVLCALEVNRGEPTTMLADGTRNIFHAMEKHGVQRIICVSAAGFLGERADFLIGKLLLWYFGRYLTRLFDAMKRQYQEL